MPFERPSIETIYGRMKADLEQRLDHTNWIFESMLLIALVVFAGAIYLVYGFLVRLSKELFFTTADEFVPWHHQLWGLPEKDANKASTGENGYRFTGVDATVIDRYTEVQTAGGVVFRTDEEVTITSGSALVGLTAKVKGSEGNVESSTMTLVSPIIGVDSEGTVLVQPTGGTDAETVDEGIARLLQRTRNPPGSGNRGDYERWALEVSGVGRAWTRSATEWKGAGTCAVIVATSDLSIVDAQTRTAVTEYIEDRRPIGADVDIVDPVPVSFGFEISITPDTSSLRSAILEALGELFLTTSQPGGTLEISKIRKAISTTSVEDYEITDTNRNGVSLGSVRNLETELLELAQLSETNTVFSELS
jgi:uncharacterized phage protein gp47/JayE